LITYLISAHLRLQVISRNLRGFHKDAVLTRVRLLHAAVEEERNVRIFLCLRDTGLLQAMCSQELAECICDLFLYKRNQLVRDCHIILCKAHICGLHPLTAVKSCKIIVAECPRDLSCTVRAEV